MRRILLWWLVLGLCMGASGAGATFVFSDGNGSDGAQAPDSAQAGADGEAIIFSSTVGETAAPAADGEAANGAVEFLLTAAGDVTLGGNAHRSNNHYDKIMRQIDGDMGHFFRNVLPIFSSDDLTLVNFEGTLTNATAMKERNTFCFRAPPEHVQMLTLGSVEAVAFENNHVMDFYEQGYQDTIDQFEQNGIIYATEASPGVFGEKGITVCLLAYQTFDGQYPRLLTQVPEDIARAKALYDIVIVNYHWGDEAVFRPNDNQVQLGRATIDAGADLVLGHHSHRVAPIEAYNGKLIVYSLGNCSFSGNSQPDNMDTYLFQQRFTVTDSGDVTSGPFRIIPCSISSVTGGSGARSGTNDLAITPFAAQSEAAQRVIDTMLENGEGLDYAVAEYPMAWPGELPYGATEEPAQAATREEAE